METTLMTLTGGNSVEILKLQLQLSLSKTRLQLATEEATNLKLKAQLKEQKERKKQTTSTTNHWWNDHRNNSYGYWRKGAYKSKRSDDEYYCGESLLSARNDGVN